MNITATHINYYFVCKRKLWLFNNGINMEHTSDTVYDGKLLHESSYPQRADKYSEVELNAEVDGTGLHGKIDFYNARQKKIHETKRSNKIEVAHEWQVKFYLWLLKLNGIDDATAILEYPLLRQTNTVRLSDSDITKLKEMIVDIQRLQQSEDCPPVIHSKICKSCSYYEFCYVGE